MQYAAAMTLIFLCLLSSLPEWKHRINGMHRDFKLLSSFHSIFYIVDGNAASFLKAQWHLSMRDLVLFVLTTKCFIPNHWKK